MKQEERRVSSGKMEVSIKLFTRNLTGKEMIRIKQIYSRIIEAPEYKNLINQFNKEAREVLKQENKGEDTK